MGIQANREEEFPFDKNRKCWYLIVYNDKLGKIQYYSIMNSYKSSLCMLACICEAIIKTKNNNVLIFGVWHGKYNTDLFYLEPNKVLNILKMRGYKCTYPEVFEDWTTILGKQ